MANVARKFTIETRRGIHVVQGWDSAQHFASVVERIDLGDGRWRNPNVRYETTGYTTPEQAIERAREWAAANGFEVTP